MFLRASATLEEHGVIFTEFLKNTEVINIKLLRTFELLLHLISNQYDHELLHQLNNDKNKKKHSRTSPDVQLKEFSLTKQKTKPRTD